MKAAPAHTNKQWYSYPAFGSYYRLDQDRLLQLPMLDDGARAGSDEDAAEVDFIRGVSSAESRRLVKVVKQLKGME